MQNNIATIDIDSVAFDANGLVPAIVQDFLTGEVLTLAYMNRESLEISLRERHTCFFSRSRQQLWRKGETSGNTQKIVAIEADCDHDALLVWVVPNGPACHTGATTCFNEMVYSPKIEPLPVSERFTAYMEKHGFSLEALYTLICERKLKMPEGSYTTYLFNKGDDKILKKVGEENAEVIIAAKNNDSSELVYEIADLAYHVLVLMVQKNIAPAEILKELKCRHAIDKEAK